MSAEVESTWCQWDQLSNEATQFT